MDGQACRKLIEGSAVLHSTAVEATKGPADEEKLRLTWHIATIPAPSNLERKASYFNLKKIFG